MSASSNTGPAPSAVAFAPIFLANLVPLVGVFAYGWEPTTLVVIYALEVLLAFPLAALKALFAQQPPRTEYEGSSVASVENADLARKRGNVTVRSWLPPIYPRNVPFVTSVVLSGVWAAVFIGAFVIPLPVVDVLTQPEAAASVLALFVGQCLDGWRNYLRSGRYETVSPYTVIETPTRQAFFLFFVLLVSVWVMEPQEGATALLAAFVLGKLIVEWSGFRVASGGGQLTGWLSGPEAPSDAHIPPTVPETEPDVCVPTDTTAVVSTGVLSALTERAPRWAGMFAIAWIFLVTMVDGDLIGGDISVGLTIASAIAVVGLFALVVVGWIVEYVIEYGSLEYRQYGDCLVVYDVWTDEPQWAVPVAEVREPAVRGDLLADRLLGTRTIEVTIGEGEDETNRQFGPVSDPKPLVEIFELPSETAELQPIDRRFGTATVGSLAASGVAAVALVVGPWPWIDVLLYTVFILLPLATLVPRILWKRASRDES